MLPDLIIKLWETPDKKWITPYPPIAGKQTYIGIIVKNIGNAPVTKPFNINFYVDNKLAHYWTYSPSEDGIEIIPLLPNTTSVFSHTITLDEGKHELRFVVDPENEIVESDESENSNILTVSETWHSTSQLPDLVVEDIWHEGPLIIEEKQIWKVKIANKGNSPAIGKIKTVLKNSDGVQFAVFDTDFLGIGGSKIFKTEQKPSIVPKKETIIATVDIGNLIAESNENNNQLSKTFDISYVDLEVVSVSVYQEKMETIFIIKIRNNGPADALKPFKVYLWPGVVYPADLPLTPENEGDAIGPVFLNCPKIKSGEIVELKHKVTLPLSDFKVRVEADHGPDYPHRVYREPPEKLKNNVLTKEIKARRVILLVIDGLRPDKLNSYLKGELNAGGKSGLLEMGLAGSPPSQRIEVAHAKTVFPSITICANASISTGLYPNHHGITGNKFYKGDKDQWMDYESKELAPTLFGFYDYFGNQNWAAVLNGWQYPSNGNSGPDKDLAELGVQTVYDILRVYSYPSHVIFHFYSKGAGYQITEDIKGYAEQLDGWDPPIKDDLICNATIASNDDRSFFEHFDQKSANKAIDWIENLPSRVPFPRLLTIYFASIDHSCHILGLSNASSGVNRDIQREYLLKIDQELYEVIKTYKSKFPDEFDNTIFIITSDHGHETVSRYKYIPTSEILYALSSGPWTGELATQLGVGTYDPHYVDLLRSTLASNRKVVIAHNGPMVQIYVKQCIDGNNSSCESFREKIIKPMLANFCWSLENGRIMSSYDCISMVIGRLPSDMVYKCFRLSTREEVPVGPLTLMSSPLPNTLQYINTMLNSEKRSGDIILLANQKKQWQFAGRPHATNISIPLTSVQNMRVPFSEHYNSASTHGSVDTMDVPLIFVGKSIPKSETIPEANVVDIVPTILNILGVPIPTPMDGKPLMNADLTTGGIVRAKLAPLESKPEVIKLAEPSVDLIIGNINSQANRKMEFMSVHYGKVTITFENLKGEKIKSSALVIDPGKRTERIIKGQRESLTFNFDSRTIPDGTHQISLKATSLNGSELSCLPIEVTFDNSPPDFIRFESVSRINDETGTLDKGNELIEVQLTALDKAGVERVVLFDGDPINGKLIGETFDSHDNKFIFLCELPRQPNKPNLLYAKAYDRAGNSLLKKFLVEFEKLQGYTPPEVINEALFGRMI